jgi:CheY-like chemotaxis protein
LILVADDDEAVRELIGRGLLDHGYRVLSATNGAEAVSLHKAHARDVAFVIADVDMPLMSGEQAIAAMREHNPSLPAVFLSGTSTTAPAEGTPPGENSPITTLRKPFAWDDLLRCVARGLQKSSLIH